jgi:phage protein D
MWIPTRGAALLLNDPAVRQPRLRVLVDGGVLAGVIAATVESNNHFAADRFHVAVALGADPVRGAAFWADAANVTVEVQVALDGTSWVSLIDGTVDQLEIDPLAGCLDLNGRDQSTALIEARTQETFANRTSSEIAGILAARHGLSSDIQATTTPVGRYWQLEHDQTSLDQFSHTTTEWDLLVAMAEHESFDLWVSGGALHFRAPEQTAAPAMVLRPSDLISLRLERSLVLAQDVKVTVKSWQSRQGVMIRESATATQGSGGTTTNYVYVMPNLTADAARQLAERRLAELTQHERVLVAEMPGELDLTPRTVLGLAGTGTAFDQSYRIDEIERRLHAVHGFTQSVRARAASAASIVSVGANA